MKLAMYGSSLLLSSRNRTAAYYRGILGDLAGRGYDITFYEPDALDGEQHSDFDPPAWAKSLVYPPTAEGHSTVLERAADAEVVIISNGGGIFDEVLVDGILEHAAGHALRIFWDVDSAVTLEEMRGDDQHPVRRNLASFDMVLTSGGGPPVVELYREFGAANCVPVYDALDPTMYHPVDPNPNYDADLSFRGSRLPSNEAGVEQFLVAAAQALPDRRFLIGGEGWETKAMPANVRYAGRVPSPEYNAFNCTPLAVLNVACEDSAATGFLPPARVFEATGAAACLITDAWDGIELFLQPETEVLVARDAQDVAQYVKALTPVVARAIGEAALRRVLFEHTYANRGTQVDGLLSQRLQVRRSSPSAPPSAVPA